MASLLATVLLLRFIICEATQSCFDFSNVHYSFYVYSQSNEAIFYTDESMSNTSVGWSILNDPSDQRLVEDPFLLYAFLKVLNGEPPCFPTTCPNLVKYYTEFTEKPDNKYNARFVSTSGNGTSQRDIAGYLAPTPGYCGAMDDPLFQIYFESTTTYVPVHASDLERVEIFDGSLRYRDIRSLGYSFKNDTELLSHGTAPHYIDPAAKPAKTYHPLLFIFRFKSKTGTKYTYAAADANVDKYYDSNPLYEFDDASINLLKYDSLIATARAKCGATTYLYEVYDKKTDVTRLSPTTKINPTDKLVGVAGLSFKNASVSCQFTREIVEYQNKNDPTQFIISLSDDTQYSSSDDWIITQRLGFVRTGSLLLGLPV